MSHDDLDTETIEVKSDTWVALNARKAAGQSFDDVIRELINETPQRMGTIETQPPQGPPAITEELVEEGCPVVGEDGERCGGFPAELRRTYLPEENSYLVWSVCADHADVQPTERWKRVLHRILWAFREGQRQHEKRKREQRRSP